MPSDRRTRWIRTGLTGITAVTAVTVTAAFAALIVASAAGEADVPVDLAGVLGRLGARVEAYYARAQSIICVETVRVQRMDHNLTPEPHTRVLVYELRVQRDGATDSDPMPEANVLRQLKTINGRVPKPNGDPDCLDPNDIALDSLSFLLPHHQRDYKFSYKGSSRSNGRAAAVIDYAPIGSGPVEATWRDGCVSIDAPARTSGRVWIDTATGDVLRVDEQLRGPIELEIPKPQRVADTATLLIFERADSSIRYKAVAFSDPDEMVLLPESIENVSVARGVYSSVRMTHTFTGYQRFVTGGRILP